MLAQEKSRRKEEEKATRDRRKRNKSLELQAREALARKGKEFSTDASGSIVPISRLPTNKFRDMQPVARAKVADGLVVNNTIPAKRDLPPQEDNAPAEASGMMDTESVDSRVADLSGIEPGFGVTVRTGADGAKKGRSFAEDPRVAAKTGFSFLHKGKSGALAANHRAVTSVPRAKSRPPDPESINVSRNEQTKMEAAESLLVRPTYVFPGGLKTNKSFAGALPTSAVSYARYKKNVRSVTKRQHTRVIVARESLIENLELAEEHAVSRAATALKHTRTVYKPPGTLFCG